MKFGVTCAGEGSGERWCVFLGTLCRCRLKVSCGTNCILIAIPSAVCS